MSKQIGKFSGYFEEEMICLDCGEKYKHKHGISESFRKLFEKCPKCKSIKVISELDANYYENEMKPYLESRLKDEYFGQEDYK